MRESRASIEDSGNQLAQNPTTQTQSNSHATHSCQKEKREEIPYQEHLLGQKKHKCRSEITRDRKTRRAQKDKCKDSFTDIRSQATGLARHVLAHVAQDPTTVNIGTGFDAPIRMNYETHPHTISNQP